MKILLILVALFLIVIITLQSKGSGLSIIPGSGDFGKFERRGGEKVLHNVTIVGVTLFTLLSLVIYLTA
jgi:protein translocase SecG subunit